MNDSEIIKTLQRMSRERPDGFGSAVLTLIERRQANAVKEFAENLKRKSELVAPSVWATPYRAVAVADIDRLLEGMGCNDD